MDNDGTSLRAALFLVEDMTGKGHDTRMLEDGDVLILFLPIVE